MKKDEETIGKLLIISGILIISSFLLSFLMVINIIPSSLYILSFLAYGMSFLGLNLFIYAYYQTTKIKEDEYR